MSKLSDSQNPEPIDSAAAGVAQALADQRHRRPSASFRIELHSPEPRDPRKDLAALAAVTESFKERNNRMGLGVLCGFHRLEAGLIPEDELRSARYLVQKDAQASEERRIKERRNPKS